MTLTEFHERALTEFGAARVDHVLSSHHLAALGDRTAAQALDEGADAKSVWQALARDFGKDPSVR